MDNHVREYMLPVLNTIQNNILVLSSRIGNRDTRQWRASEFALVAATSRQIAQDCEWISTTLEVIRDIENGELER